MTSSLKVGGLKLRTAIATLLAVTAVAVAAPAVTQPSEAEAIPTSPVCRQWEITWLGAPLYSDVEYFYRILLETYCWPQ